MKKLNYKLIQKSIIGLILIITLTVLILYVFLIRQYRNDSLEGMREAIEEDGNYEYGSYIFSVKIDNKDNILDIINNDEFGIERDIYRIIRTNKISGIGYIKNKPIRYLKENKDYGKIIVFQNRISEVNNIKLICKSIVEAILVSIIILVFVYILLKKLFS